MPSWRPDYIPSNYKYTICVAIEFNLPTLSAVLTACQSINRHPGMSSGGEEISFRTLFVKNLEENHTKRDLFTLFGPYGKIITYRIILNKVGRVYGFVTFLNPDSALAALMDLNGKLVGNGRLIVEPARLQWPQNIWQKLPKTPYKRSIHYKRKSQYDTKVI
ncbi:unnamed protein product [Ceratitis capitata]|uniref:(Mediterranean fruit fly) hypothetical protein n=1 Tax=Ceratitis capitata TaxID=7213 RepID=A0A811UQ71_CERCA|nr:unnamed protein product [Ceratitis capitata]